MKFHDYDILVVDDEIPNLRLLTQILSEEGYQVRPAERPQLAIESALAEPPSLILLDVRMPEMNGFQVCELLKQDSRTSDIPIIFVSALQETEERIQGFEAGGVDFISKPFQELEVLARVRTHLSLRNMQAHLEELVAKRTMDLEAEIADRKRVELTLLDHQRRLKALASELTIAEERERRRIATDLHDYVGQNLTLALLQLSAASKTVNEVTIKQQFEELTETLSCAVRDTQKLTYDLSSPTLETLGLGPAIVEWVDQKIKPHHDIDFNLVDEHDRARLGHHMNLILFRNIRELLTNIVKHAQANKVTVLLEHKNGSFQVSVKDNGIGFNPEQVQQDASSEGGLGLFSIKERLSDFDGSLMINSKAHYGATIVMSIPNIEFTDEVIG